MNIARIVFTALLCAIPCWAAATNIVLNAGLELGTIDWRSRNMFIGHDPAWAHTGIAAARTGCAGAVCIDTLGEGSFISQVLSTSAGDYYDLSFWVRSTGSAGEFSVFWDGLMIDDHINPGGPMRSYTYSGLTASGSATLLEIHGRADGAMLSFDDVAVLQAGMVPEPLTYAMLVAGLGVLVLALRRRPRWSAN